MNTSSVRRYLTTENAEFASTTLQKGARLANEYARIQRYATLRFSTASRYFIFYPPFLFRFFLLGSSSSLTSPLLKVRIGGNCGIHETSVNLDGNRARKSSGAPFFELPRNRHRNLATLRSHDCSPFRYTYHEGYRTKERVSVWKKEGLLVNTF